MEGQPADPGGLFTTETAGLPDASAPQVIRLNDGDRFDLHITPVRKRIDDAQLRMLGYNGSIPGPTLHVDQGSEITVEVRNDGDLDATVHWHGLRLKKIRRSSARYPGTDPDRGDVHLQGPVSRRRLLLVPPAHPRGLRPGDGVVRDDRGGTGRSIVSGLGVDRQLTITLDDLLVEDGHIAAFSRSGTNFTAMGRFGNVMLINGETAYSGSGDRPGSRPPLPREHRQHPDLQLRLSGARMKLVGGGQRSVRA